MTHRLTTDMVITLHGVSVCDAPLIDRFKLESAVDAPYAGHFAGEFYPTLIQKAGKLCEGIARAHPFLDGNKRIAWLSCTTLLGMNGVQLIADQVEAAEMVVRVTTGEMDDGILALWLNERAY